jgi:A/G-specific adenine glycosylase
LPARKHERANKGLTQLKVGQPVTTRNFSRFVIQWFQESGRRFLWREKLDPWLLVVSEILLKKTSAERINEFVPKFIEKYNSPAVVTLIPSEELCSDLSPLGLQRQRTKQLKALCAELKSRFSYSIPRDEESLLSLPGIGEYAANAIRCFAFGQRVPIVDTNVVRIFIRVFNVCYSHAEARRSPEIWELAWELLPENPSLAVKYNFGLLDLGALICIPACPKCKICPIKDICLYHRSDISAIN